jgi:phage terminase large subunit-like protein
MKMVDTKGQPYRKAEALKRVEQLGEAEHRQTTIYDVTRVLFEEMMFFPFSPRDDLVDAMSRYNDLQPVTPALIEERQAAPAIYADT